MVRERREFVERGNPFVMPTLKIPEAQFVRSCPHLATAPRPPLREIAFAGRSNVGKSSLINSLLGRKKLALTSRTPGKTRLLNYYLVGRDLCYFVDLPGYGFARVSVAELEKWSESLEEYLRDATRLMLVVLILDIRHGPTALDEQMMDALQTYHRPWLAVLTKADKLSASAARKTESELAAALIQRGARAALAYSAETHLGRERLWEEILAALGR